MKVYIIVYHYRGEGDFIEGVFYTKESAQKCLETHKYPQDCTIEIFVIQ